MRINNTHVDKVKKYINFSERQKEDAINYDIKEKKKNIFDNLLNRPANFQLSLKSFSFSLRKRRLFCHLIPVVLYILILSMTTKD